MLGSIMIYKSPKEGTIMDMILSINKEYPENKMAIDTEKRNMSKI